MLGKYWVYNRDVDQIFIDFNQAYDRVSRGKLWAQCLSWVYVIGEATNISV